MPVRGVQTMTNALLEFLNERGRIDHNHQDDGDGDSCVPVATRYSEFNSCALLFKEPHHSHAFQRAQKECKEKGNPPNLSEIQ